MKQGTKIITLDNGYHLWTNTQGTGDIHCWHYTVDPAVNMNIGKTLPSN